MSREANHTPLPWFVGRSHRGDQELLWVDSCDAPSCGIADLYHRIDAGPEGFYAKPEAGANAALIVMAVNAHEHLVKALREIANGWVPEFIAAVGDIENRDLTAAIVALQKHAFDALAKAEEKPVVLPPKVEAP